MTTAPDHVSTEAARPGRLPRSERRAQLLESALEVGRQERTRSADEGRARRRGAA